MEWPAEPGSGTGDGDGGADLSHWLSCQARHGYFSHLETHKDCVKLDFLKILHNKTILYE